MQLTITISDNMVKHLRRKLGPAVDPWGEYVSRWIEQEEAEFINWKGLPQCWLCGEPVDPDVGDELVQSPDGDMHRHCFEGHERRYE
jgi:hypothetical protein